MDSKGMNDEMNEQDRNNYNEQVGFQGDRKRTNGDDYGLRVPANYYLEIVHGLESQQRNI